MKDDHKEKKGKMLAKRSSMKKGKKSLPS